MPVKRKHPFLASAGKGLLLLFCALAIYLFVVLLNPQSEEMEKVSQEVLPAPAPAVVLESAGEMNRILSMFPAPVLACSPSAGIRLIAGTCYDTPFEGGYARVAALRYSISDTEVDAVSIYPARALELLGLQDYHLSLAPSPLLSGWNSVRMENASTIRLHIQTRQGLYAITVPREAVGLLSEMIRPLQLMTLPSP